MIGYKSIKTEQVLFLLEARKGKRGPKIFEVSVTQKTKRSLILQIIEQINGSPVRNGEIWRIVLPLNKGVRLFRTKKGVLKAVKSKAKK